MVRPTEFKAHHDPAKAYSKMLAELTADDLRNRLIASDVAIEAEKTDGICLVLSDRKQHCETLRAILAFRHKIAAEVLTGDVDIGQRALILKELADGNIKVLIATGQLLGEGFDCPNLSSLFLTTPIRFSGRVLQYIGRVLRPAPGKHQARIFDYVDVHVGVLKSAADARQRVYQGESMPLMPICSDYQQSEFKSEIRNINGQIIIGYPSMIRISSLILISEPIHVILELAMPDDFAIGQVDDFLGDIGGMVGDPLDVTGNQEHVDQDAHVLRRLKDG